MITEILSVLLFGGALILQAVEEHEQDPKNSTITQISDKAKEIWEENNKE